MRGALCPGFVQTSLVRTSIDRPDHLSVKTKYRQTLSTRELRAALNIVTVRKVEMSVEGQGPGPLASQ